MKETSTVEHLMTKKKGGYRKVFSYGGPWGTLPELLFEKKGLIPALQQLLVSHPLLT